jgi:hypothetical protein
VGKASVAKNQIHNFLNKSIVCVYIIIFIYNTIMTYRKDITGKKFNKLTALTFSHLNKSRHAVWICKCECGNETTAQSRFLINGAKKSCGCIRNEVGSHTSSWKGYGGLSKTRFSKIIVDAKNRNIDFNLSIEFLWDLFQKQNGKCVISGEPICFPNKVHESDGTASLDRIDSNKDYSEDNVQWVHKDINVMKWNLSQDKFFDWIKKIHTYKNLGL